MEKFYIIDKKSLITYYIVGVKSARPNKQVTITEYPVPEGGKISDHAYLEPVSLSLSIISDGFDVVRKSYFINDAGVSVSLSATEFKELINEWYRNHTRLDIQTLHGRFENMVLEGVSWNEESSSWSNFSPTISFREVKISSIFVTTVSALDLEAGANYTAERNSGTDNGIEVKSSAGVAGKVLGDAAVGAGIGAAVGSIIPGVGTGLGALAGGAVGAVVGFIKHLLK